jgi:multiple sugar transport system ATP-binding protein
MRDGVIQQTGSPRELYERPCNLFVAGFMGSPAMNLLPAELRDSRIRLPVPGVDLMPPAGMRLPPDPGQLIAGIRPEHIQLAESGGEAHGFEVSVEMAEWLGADLLVHFRVGAGTGHEVIARLDGGVRARAGDTLRLALAPEFMTVFDALSGEALSATCG